jgi:gliding motility-associated-like protein
LKRLRILKLILLFTAILDFTLARGQSVNCVGSLGDPVITETFGSGSNPGNPLPAGISNMAFTSYCPNDGSYTIVNATNIYGGATGNCHPATWQDVFHDHTGDANGYMMMINASYTPSIFFTKTTPAVLCENTTYEFSAYILNLIRAGSSGIRPNIKFTIETVDGLVLDSLVTGDILESNNGDDWIRKSFFFTTPPNTSQVVLKMTNQAPGGNGNDLLLDDINFRACGPVVQTGFSTVDANQPQNQCVGESKVYTLKSKIGAGYANPKMQWQVNKNDGNGWLDIAGETTDTYTFTVGSNTPGVYQYRLAAAGGANINSATCRVYSEPLSVGVNPYPVVPDVPPVQECEGKTVTLNVFGGATVDWTGPGITAANKNQNPLVLTNIKPADAGTYNVIVTSAAGCSTSKSTTVTVIPRAVITLNGPSVTICKGAATNLSASAPGAISYKWMPGKGLSDSTIANPVASPADTTIYKVIATNNIGCTDTAMLTVNVLPPPVAITQTKQSMFQDRPITLVASAQSADVFSWTPTTGLSDANVLNPVANPADDIKYTLHVKSSYNCGEDTSSVFVKVYHKIGIPNAFSPNADGANDSWEIEGLFTYPESITTVFNRYGQQVFKSIGYAKPWKGTYNGANLPPGTYYYIIDLKTGQPRLTGWVLIVN